MILIKKIAACLIIYNKTQGILVMSYNIIDNNNRILNTFGFIKSSSEKNYSNWMNALQLENIDLNDTSIKVENCWKQLMNDLESAKLNLHKHKNFLLENKEIDHIGFVNRMETKLNSLSAQLNDQYQEVYHTLSQKISIREEQKKAQFFAENKKKGELVKKIVERVCVSQEGISNPINTEEKKSSEMNEMSIKNAIYLLEQAKENIQGYGDLMKSFTVPEDLKRKGSFGTKYLSLTLSCYILENKDRLSLKQMTYLDHMAKQLLDASSIGEDIENQKKHIAELFQSERSPCFSLLEQSERKLNELDQMDSELQKIGVYIPSGFQFRSQESQKIEGHASGIGIRKYGEDDYTLDLCNAGGGALGFKDSNTGKGQTIVKYSNKLREDVQKTVHNSLIANIDIYQGQSYQKAVERYQKPYSGFIPNLSFKIPSRSEEFMIPDRPFQTVGNCTVRSPLEWVYHSLQLLGEHELATEIEQYRKQSSGSFEPIQELIS